MKVSLTCALVGEAGRVFDVDIDDGKKVTKLKEAIKVEEFEMIKCEAAKMRLILAKKGKAWLDWAGAAAVTLGEDGYLQYFEMSPTLFVKDPKNFGENFQPCEGQVHVLVVAPQREPPSTQIYPTFRPYPEGPPHLPRDALVEKLHDAVLFTNLVLLSSPSGSGKTSLLTLFRDRFPAIHCVVISLNHSGPARQILSQHGIDVSKRTCLLHDDGAIFVVMLDDSQCQYHDLSFWSLLVKGSSSWIPLNVRFVISATHSLESEWSESPVDFRSFRKRIMRDDLLLGDDEVRQLFDLGNGLPSKLRSQRWKR